MKARVLAVVFVLAALAVPPAASADPKPAGCAGVLQVTGNSCTFMVEAGNDGSISLGLVHVATGVTTWRLDLLRGNTVVYSTGGTDESGTVSFGGDIGGNTALPAGTYRCRITATGPVVVTAYECAVE